MYKVVINNDGVETMIHSPHVGGLKLPSGVIKKEINLIDSFNFNVYMDNPGYRKIKPLMTLVKVLNTKTGKYEFEGRVLGPSKQMDNSGVHSTSYECEGEMGYLHDSIQRHLEFRGTPGELLSTIINYHNLQVEAYKHFQVGKVTVSNSTNNLYLYLSGEKDTFETIKEKLIDKLDGELQIRKIDGVRFLDLVERVGEDKNTEIRIAKNLMSMSCDIDPTQVVTRLTPLGTRIQSVNEGDTDASEARLTIESVNNGLPYIDDKALIREFGIQGKSVTWDAVTIAENLLAKGRDWLVNQKTAHVQYKISALDLFLIGMDINSFEVGNSYPVKNPIMAIDEMLRVIGKSLDINNPQGASLTIGDKFKTLNQYQSDLKKSAENIVDIRATVVQQRLQINSLSTSLGEAQEELKVLKESVESTDLKEVVKSIDIIGKTLENLEGEIHNLPTVESINQLQTGIKENANSITVTDKKVSSLEDTFEAINKKLSLFQEDLEGLIKRVTILEGKGGS